MGSKGNINTLILDLEGACPGASTPFPHLQPKSRLALLGAALAHPYDSRNWPVPPMDHVLVEWSAVSKSYREDQH